MDDFPTTEVIVLVLLIAAVGSCATRSVTSDHGRDDNDAAYYAPRPTYAPAPARPYQGGAVIGETPLVIYESPRKPDCATPVAGCAVYPY